MMNFNNHSLRKGTKKHRVVELFCQGEKLSCLNQNITGDTCLHSTVSSLTKAYKLEIPRERISLPNARNHDVLVTRYWFSIQDIINMKGLL